MAWQIVKHAFLMIFNNFGQAVRVSLVPSVLMILGWVVLMAVAGIPIFGLDGAAGLTMGEDGLANFGLLPLLLLIVAIALSMFVAGWVAVSWHRFILLEEYSGFLPATEGRPIWGYVGKSLLLGLLIALAAIPLSFIVGFLFAGMITVSGQLPVFPTLLAGLMLGTAIGYLWFRMAICLPAKAVHDDLTFGAAWGATADLSGTIFGVTVIIVALNVFVGAALGLAVSGAPLLSAILEVAINWLSTMVGISVLTTLYGHLIEGRPLVE